MPKASQTSQPTPWWVSPTNTKSQGTRTIGSCHSHSACSFRMVISTMMAKPRNTASQFLITRSLVYFWTHVKVHSASLSTVRIEGKPSEVLILRKVSTILLHICMKYFTRLRSLSHTIGHKIIFRAI